MKIGALYCKNCNEIIISRKQHDMVFCSCGQNFVDGGFLTQNKDFIPRRCSLNEFSSYVEIDGSKMLEFMFYMDCKGNSENSIKNFPDGYWKKFKLIKTSNEEFYRNIIIDYENSDVKKYFSKLAIRKNVFNGGCDE